jgi:predicted CXXCH cytochrome family protein
MVLAGVVLVAGGCDRPAPVTASAPTASAAERLPPRFVGQAVCAPCHEAETAAWRGSQHAQAMQPATPPAVLGDFRDATFTYAGVTSTFFREGERYVVRTDGPDGTLADFAISYTFGLYPLQQYLVDFPDGRKQALSIAWDARPAEQGGQRWFHLYPNERVDHRDPLHWTRLDQNWNSMCADCHSTNLRRHYDLATDRFATSWSDVAVACEACHGPGSGHVAWAAQQPGGAADARKGLVVALDERAGMRWETNAAGQPARSRPLGSRREVETCAACHARRRPLGDDPGPTGRLLDTHDPALLEARLFELDGQQREEVYTYASFLQSKMYARGVTCSDCHDPHTQKLRAPGNAVCTECHAAGVYDASAHHGHRADQAGGRCVECHMPTRTYMVIDPRHDHSLRVPRPDLTRTLGVPNACNGCHADQDAAWAAGAIAATHGPDRKGFQTFAPALQAGRSGAPGAGEQLAALVRDATVPDIARATAARELARFAGAATLPAVRAALADASALVRAAALEALQAFPLAAGAMLAAPLAGDPVKAVRVKAGRALVAAPLADLRADERARRTRAIDEYLASERAAAERPESHLNLGIVAAERGDPAGATAEYRTAIRLDPGFVPAYANLADLARALGREADAAATLAAGLKAVPNDPTLTHALGLQRIREQRSAEALPLLQRAAEARPDDARFVYVYGIALHSVGRVDEAIAVLQQALARAPYDPDILAGLMAFNRDAGRPEAAGDYARRLAEAGPPRPAVGADQAGEP